MSLDYAYEKMFNAVSSAVSSNRSLSQKLEDAIVYNVVHVSKEDLPAKTWGRIEKLMADVTAQEAKGKEGKIRATITLMSDEKIATCLDEIVSIFGEVAAAYKSKHD